jgi:hypothetical protein
MKTKMLATLYPGASKKVPWFWKSSDVNGTIEIVGDQLVFTAKLFGVIRMKGYDFQLPLMEIESLDYLTLNLILSWGLCITMKDGQEYVFGSLNRKGLYEMISVALWQ